jgi:hypothetical protein
MPGKSEIYTWRVSAAMKASLEEQARATDRSVAQLLDEIVAGHLSASEHAGRSEGAHQGRLHARAAPFLGCMASGVARRGERARELVRARLKRRRALAR